TRYGAGPRAVCRWTFGTARAIDVITDFYDPDSWQCWQVSRELGRLDFAAYCRETGHADALLVRQDPHGGYCTDSTPDLRRVRLVLPARHRAQRRRSGL